MPKERISIFIFGSNVEKTSLALHYTENLFSEQTIHTPQPLYFSKTINISKRSIRLEILDTELEQDSFYIPIYLRLTKGVIFVFDLTKHSPLAYIEIQIENYIENIPKLPPMLLLGNNKCDLIKEREITLKEIQEITFKYSIPYLEISVKENININKAFDYIIHKG